MRLPWFYSRQSVLELAASYLFVKLLEDLLTCRVSELGIKLGARIRKQTSIKYIVTHLDTLLNFNERGVRDEHWQIRFRHLESSPRILQYFMIGRWAT